MPAGRVVVGILLMALAMFFVINQVGFRAVEARLIAPTLGFLTHTGWYTTGVDGATARFGVGSGQEYGLRFTTMCSSVILVSPLLVLGGIMLLVRSFRLGRVFAGLGVALALSVACNMIRFVAIGLALHKWGMPGFDIVHHWFGSVFVILGFAASFVLLIWIAGGRKKTPVARPVAKRAVSEDDA